MSYEDNIVERIEKEFVGETVVYEVDGAGAWIYDELSLGVYYLDINKRSVEIIIQPEEIHKDEVIPIIALKRNCDELILIPERLKYDWIIFHLGKKSVQRIRPIDCECRINSVMKTRSYLYLIPGRTDQPIFILRLIDYKLKLKRQRLFENKYSCWGAVLCGESIIIPIIGTNAILKIENENIQLIKFNFSVKIMSVYQADGEIWILPMTGNKIYRTEKGGVLKDGLKIVKKDQSVSASRFQRIIVTDYGTFLLPLEDSDIYVCKKTENTFKCIESKCERSIYSMLSLEESNPFWGYISCKHRFCLLPIKRRYAEIDMRDMSIQYFLLEYGQTLSAEKYKKWITNAFVKNNRVYKENTKNLFKEFLNYLKSSDYNDIKNYKYGVGKNIFELCNF